MATPNLIRCREKEKLLSAEYIRSILDYSPETGFLTWKWRQNARPQDNGKLAGKTAGCKHHTGYICIRINNIEYNAHRLAWLHYYGKFPENQIDHINLVKDDNKIINLREATHFENGRNIAKRKNGLNKFKGVNIDKRCKFNPYFSEITLNRKTINLGYFKTPEEAHEAYCEASKKIHGEFGRAK